MRNLIGQFGKFFKDHKFKITNLTHACLSHLLFRLPNLNSAIPNKSYFATFNACQITHYNNLPTLLGAYFLDLSLCYTIIVTLKIHLRITLGLHFLQIITTMRIMSNRTITTPTAIPPISPALTLPLTGTGGDGLTDGADSEVVGLTDGVDSEVIIGVV